MPMTAIARGAWTGWYGAAAPYWPARSPFCAPREVEPVLAPDIAIKDLADMEAQINFRSGQRAPERSSVTSWTRARISASALNEHAQAALESSAVKIASVPYPIS